MRHASHSDRGFGGMGRSDASKHVPGNNQEGPRNPRPFFQRWSLERNLFRLLCNRPALAHLLLACAVELADGIGLHLPSLDRHGDLVLALAELLLVGAADKHALDVEVIALPQLRGGVLAEAVPRDDAMPLRLGMPLFFGPLSGALSRE